MGPIGAIVGGVVGFAGGFSSAQTEQSQLKMGAAAKRQQAASLRNRLAMKLRNMDRAQTRSKGAVVASFAANGIASTGSALEVVADNAREYAIAKQQVKFMVEEKLIEIEHEARSLDITRKNINPWEQALFAGIQGAAGGFTGNFQPAAQSISQAHQASNTVLGAPITGPADWT